MGQATLLQQPQQRMPDNDVYDGSQELTQVHERAGQGSAPHPQRRERTPASRSTLFSRIFTSRPRNRMNISGRVSPVPSRNPRSATVRIIGTNPQEIVFR